MAEKTKTQFNSSPLFSVGNNRNNVGSFSMSCSVLAPSMFWYSQNWTLRFCYLLLHRQHRVLKCHVVHLANFL